MDGGAEPQSLVPVLNIPRLYPKALHKTWDVNTYVLMIVNRSSDGDIKLGGPFHHSGIGFLLHPLLPHIHHSYITLTLTFFNGSAESGADIKKWVTVSPPLPVKSGTNSEAAKQVDISTHTLSHTKLFPRNNSKSMLPFPVSCQSTIII